MEELNQELTSKESVLKCTKDYITLLENQLEYIKTSKDLIPLTESQKMLDYIEKTTKEDLGKGERLRDLIIKEIEESRFEYKTYNYPCVVALTNDYDTNTYFEVIYNVQTWEHFQEENYVRLATNKELMYLNGKEK